MTKGKGKNPGAGSLSKHVKRVIHRERAQPAARAKFGGLEKHKDYKKRAALRHAKVKQLQKIKRAVATRNPDEWNIKMVRRRVDSATGKVRELADRSLDARRKKAEKTLEENKTNVDYLSYRARQDRRTAEGLLHEVVGLEQPPQNTHTIFVDTADDVRAFDAREFFGVADLRALQTPAVRGRADVIARQPRDLGLAAGAAADAADSRRAAAVKFREVAQRLQRAQKLTKLATDVRKNTERVRAGIRTKATKQYAKGAAVRKR